MNVNLPTDEQGLKDALAQGLLAETHYLDFKRQLTRTKGGNTELAKDLASFSLDGGHLVIGVAEDKQANTFSMNPVDLRGLKEVVSTVATDRVAPSLVVRCIEIPAGTPQEGYLIVEVPPSPYAPHMVDGTYYGRADTTRRRLLDVEVRERHERRARQRTSTEDLLDVEIARDPHRENATEGHYFFVGHHDGHDPEMLLNALQAAGKDLGGYREELFLRGGVDPNARGTYGPSAQWLRETHRRDHGFALTSGYLGEDRSALMHQADDDAHTIDVEFGDDGSIRVYCGRATMHHDRQSTSREGRELFVDLIDGVTADAVRFVQAVSVMTGYPGTWYLGVAITDIDGAPMGGNLGAFRGGAYPGPTYRHTAQVSAAETADAQAVASKLLGSFRRTLGR